MQLMTLEDSGYNATITLDTSIYQNIWVNQNFNRNIIIGSGYNMFIIRPNNQNDVIATIQYSGNYISFVIVKFKIKIFIDDVSVLIEIDSTFTTITGFVLDNKKVFAIKFVTNSFTHPEFLLS